MQKKQHFCCATAIVLISTLAGLSMVGSTQGADGQTSAQPRSGTTEYFNHAKFRADVSSLILISFDERDPGNGVLTGNEYAAKGLTIVQRDRLPINVFNAKDNMYYHLTNFNSQPNGISSANGVNNDDWPSRSDNFDFVFSKPVNAAGLWIGNLNGTTEIQFLSAGQCVIATQKADGNHKNIIKGGSEDPWDNRIFYGITTNQRIERIRVINPPNDGDGIVLDDIQFGLASSKQLGESADQSIRIFAAVPSQDSAVFKSATHKSLRMVAPQGWDPVPYHMTQPFTTTITAKPGQRFFLAGDALGKTGWSIDNFLLLEIESKTGIERLIIGYTNGSPVEYQGQRLKDIGTQSFSFSPEGIDLSPYFPKNVPFRLTISALDYGSVGYVTDLFLVARDASGCLEAIGTVAKVAEINFLRKTAEGFEAIPDKILRYGDQFVVEVTMDADTTPEDTQRSGKLAWGEGPDKESQIDVYRESARIFRSKLLRLEPVPPEASALPSEVPSTEAPQITVSP